MILLATTLEGIARAELNGQRRWHVANVLGGVKATCLGASPSDSRVIYAGTNGEGVFRSDDAGRTWSNMGLTGVPIRSIAVSPQDADTVYLGAKPASVLATNDGGQSWRELESFRRSRRWYWLSPAEPPDWRAYVSSLGVSPTDPNVIVAGIEAGAVVRSEDAGITWTGHRKKADRDCHALTFHATNGDWVYEAGGGGPAVSCDAGMTWRHPMEGLAGRYCMACSADPERPEVWYVSASPMSVFPKIWQMPVAHFDGRAHASIYRSTGGSRWEKLQGGLPQPLEHMPYALVTDPNEPGHVYAGLSNGVVWRSLDYGDTWSKLPVEFGSIRRSMALVSV